MRPQLVLVDGDAQPPTARDLHPSSIPLEPVSDDLLSVYADPANYDDCDPQLSQRLFSMAGELRHARELIRWLAADLDMTEVTEPDRVYLAWLERRP